MKVYGVIGWKNAGKTGLMERLVACITARGFTVSTVKHVHHDVDLDQPGKDTFRHRSAGASEVVLASAHRFAILHEHRGPEPDLAVILTRLAPVDLVLVEGYKRDAHRKIEVFRRETGQSLARRMHGQHFTVRDEQVVDGVDAIGRIDQPAILDMQFHP